MLRDIPRVYMMVFGSMVGFMMLFTWYMNTFDRDTDTLQLNDVVLATAVSEIDQTSRVYEGALLLAPTFESATWKRLEEQYPKGSDVQFDYLFDDKDTRFTNVEPKTSSPTYAIGGKRNDNGSWFSVPGPDPKRSSYMTGRPVKAVRVKVRTPRDELFFTKKFEDRSKWTYVGTVEIDAVSKQINK